MQKSKQKPERFTFAQHREAAQRVIISNVRAEKFIARWMKKYKATRRSAIRKLRELGVKYPL